MARYRSKQAGPLHWLRKEFFSPLKINTIIKINCTLQKGDFPAVMKNLSIWWCDACYDFLVASFILVKVANETFRPITIVFIRLVMSLLAYCPHTCY
jgi:hypothetical protein